MRKIVVDDKEYQFKVGGSWVKITTEAFGKKRSISVNTSVISGLCSYCQDRGHRKGYFHITPRMIADYIKTNPQLLKIEENKEIDFLCLHHDTTCYRKPLKLRVYQ